MRCAWITSFLLVAGCASANSGSEGPFGSAGSGGGEDSGVAGAGGVDRGGGAGFGGNAGSGVGGVGGGGEGGALVPQPIELKGCQGYHLFPTSLGGSEPFNLALDTGSATLAVAATGCATCSAAGLTHLYEPGPQAVDQHKEVTEAYGDGSGYWTGNIWSERVALGGTAPVVTERIVAIVSQKEFFYPFVCKSGTYTPEGILGFGPTMNATEGTDSTLDVIAGAGVPNVFALGLCDDGGRAWIGGYDPADLSEAPRWTPMPTNLPYYSVTMTDIGLQGDSIGVSASTYSTTIVDSGGPLLYLPDSAYKALASKIGALPAFQQLFQQGPAFFDSFDTCTPQTREAIDAALPPLTLTFGSGADALQVESKASESYLQPVYDTDGSEYWCTGIGVFPGGNPYTIIGGSWLRFKVVIFDRKNGRMGFAPFRTCS